MVPKIGQCLLKKISSNPMVHYFCLGHLLEQNLWRQLGLVYTILISNLFHVGNCFLHPINFDSHPTKILKSYSTLFHTFAYGFQYPEVIFIYYGFRNLEGYFHISFKLPDGHIWKWVMSSGFLYPEWCTVNGAEDWDPELIYVCLRILISGKSFMLSK